jgi:ATP-dependent DNA helicase RecG
MTDTTDNLELSQPVSSLHGVGVRNLAKLERLGISTIRQLLWHLPARYEDYSAAAEISSIVPGEKYSVRGTVIAIANRFIWPKRMTVTTATVQDDSGAIRAVWFNQPYLEEMLAVGTEVSLAGKAVLDKRGLYLSNPAYEKIGFANDDGEHLRHTEGLVPVYPETEGVTSKYLRFLIRPLLDRLGTLEDPMPEAIRRRYALMPLAEAIRTIHYPLLPAAVTQAKERLAFDDLVLLQLKALRERRLLQLQRSPKIVLDAAYMREMVTQLPFALTTDQRVAATEILRDMERAFPMNRLLEGDVGSGKTVVVLLVALHAARAGLQTVILAPTEVLARQHYRTFRSLSVATRARTALLTGSGAMADDRTVAKPLLKRAIASGRIDITIGTHALLEGDVRWPSLALVVIDEQHRFGIQQRAALVRKTGKTQMVPHLVSMTATPIPRTLALTIFGDLDISVIREKPAGRRPIQTRVVAPEQRSGMESFIREQVRQGRQVFVICPVIETAAPDAAKDRKGQGKLSALWAQVKAVQDEYTRLSGTVFSDLKVAMLHGRMKAKEKEQVMREFSQGWHDILVSTSVIEVGVDVPNATVMLIEGADRFGLAQLHQFRGRVGRAEHQSYCFLVPSDPAAGTARLRAMVNTDDGFALAEADMKLRGPGEFFGLKQSGMPDLTMAALANPDLIKIARAAARALMKASPTLERYPLLSEQIESLKAFMHSE